MTFYRVSVCLFINDFIYALGDKYLSQIHFIFVMDANRNKNMFDKFVLNNLALDDCSHPLSWGTDSYKKVYWIFKVFFFTAIVNATFIMKD